MNLAALLLSVATGSVSVIGAIYMMIMKLHIQIHEKTSEIKVTLVENQGSLKNLEFRVGNLERVNENETVELSGLRFTLSQLASCSPIQSPGQNPTIL